MVGVVFRNVFRRVDRNVELEVCAQEFLRAVEIVELLVIEAIREYVEVDRADRLALGVVEGESIGAFVGLNLNQVGKCLEVDDRAANLGRLRRVPERVRLVAPVLERTLLELHKHVLNHVAPLVKLFRRPDPDGARRRVLYANDKLERRQAVGLVFRDHVEAVGALLQLELKVERLAHFFGDLVHLLDARDELVDLLFEFAPRHDDSLFFHDLFLFLEEFLLLWAHGCKRRVAR